MDWIRPWYEPSGFSGDRPGSNALWSPNVYLATVTTAHGIGASLRWRRRDDLDQELSTTIDLLAKPPDLRTAEEDRALAAALSTRIDRARQNSHSPPPNAIASDSRNAARGRTSRVTGWRERA